ncbi:hypothetical protein CPC197_2048, partial [Chlamydia psittaci C1/97]
SQTGFHRLKPDSCRFSPDQTRPDRLKPVLTGSNWTRPAQTGLKPDSNWTRPAETGFDRLKTDSNGF